MQRQILINVMIFFAYALNLPLNTQRPRSPLTTRWKTWPGFWLMAVARYIALPLISRYLSMDPTNRDISGLHCNSLFFQDNAENLHKILVISSRVHSFESHSPSVCLYPLAGSHWVSIHTSPQRVCTGTYSPCCAPSWCDGGCC